MSNHKIITKKEYYQKFSDDEGFLDNLFWSPIFENLPDELEVANEGTEYKYHDLPEGEYLTGVSLISADWVSPYVCGFISQELHLSLKEAFPVTLKNRNSSKTMFQLEFTLNEN